MDDFSFPLINEADERLAEHHVHEVYSPIGLWRMVYEPTDTFRLIADVDMQGERWMPLAFSGRLEGNGHTISNLRICDSLDGCEGFFTRLGKKGVVSDVTFENVNVFCDGEAKRIGAICGKNEGRIENCAVKNVVFRDGEGSLPFSRCVGVAAGENLGCVSIVGKTSAAFLTENTQNGLCGENRGSADGFWQDRSNATEFASETERAMRRRVTDKMFEMGSVRWVLERDFVFDCCFKHPWCHHDFEAKTTYYGMPYTHHHGSPERMTSCFKKVSGKKMSGILDFAAHHVHEDDGNFPDFASYIGNDCSGAVYWSWATCSADISFLVTGQMIPTEENCKKYGVVKLGSYVCDLGNNTVTQERTLSTDPENRRKLIEAYTKLREGDALVHVSSKSVLNDEGKVKTGAGGHTILVCADPVIIRDANGEIDVKRSHILTNEQGSAMGRTDTTWTLGGVWNLEQLSYGCPMKSKKGWQLYIPITNRALQNGHPDTGVVRAHQVTGPASGVVSSNWRINRTAVFVFDKNGRVLASDESYTGIAGFEQSTMQYEGIDETGHYEIPEDSGLDTVARLCFRSVNLKKHEKVLDGLPNGEYGYRVDVLLASGETKSVTGRFTKQ